MPDKIIVLNDPIKSMGGLMTQFKLHLFGYENICFTKTKEFFNWLKIHEDYMPCKGLIILNGSSLYDLKKNLTLLCEYLNENNKKNQILIVLSDLNDAAGLLDILPASIHGTFSMTDNTHLITDLSCLLRINKSSNSTPGANKL